MLLLKPFRCFLSQTERLRPTQYNKKLNEIFGSFASRICFHQALRCLPKLFCGLQQTMSCHVVSTEQEGNIADRTADSCRTICIKRHTSQLPFFNGESALRKCCALNDVSIGHARFFFTQGNYSGTWNGCWENHF